MRKISLLVAAAFAFGAAPFAGRLGLVGGSLVLVVLGVLLALAASATADALTVGSGALGALASGILITVSPAAAGAALAGLAFAERSTRVRGKVSRAVHVGMSVVAGALAGVLSNAFVSASPAVRGVAIVMAAVLVGLPLLIDAEDPLAHSLDAAADIVTGPAQASLREGAELRRTSHEIPLDSATTKRVSSTWRALLRLSEVRVRLERSKALAAPGTPASAVHEMVDQKIKDHVIALGRAYSAVDTAKAAAVGLDDAALKNVESMGADLEEVSRAMAELKT
jgi:MFS family permease